MLFACDLQSNRVTCDLQVKRRSTIEDSETPEVLVIPGAWTRVSAFSDVRETLDSAGFSSRLVELPARSRKLPQLDRGGLRAIDDLLDREIAACSSPPVLVGHSLGGLASLRAAKRIPVHALVLLMPAHPRGMLPIVAGISVRDSVNALRLLGTTLSVTGMSRFVDRVAPNRVPSIVPRGLYSSHMTPEQLREALIHRVDESWTVLLEVAVGSRQPIEPVGVPTLVVAGLQDHITPTQALRPLAGELGASYIEVDVAHAFNEEPSFTLVTDAIVEFMNGPHLRAWSAAMPTRA